MATPNPEEHLRLLGTHPLIVGFDRKLTREMRAELKRKQEAAGIQMVKKTIRSDGKKQVSGGIALKWSAHYPQDMCKEVVRLFENPDEAARVNLMLYINMWNWRLFTQKLLSFFCLLRPGEFEEDHGQEFPV